MGPRDHVTRDIFKFLCRAILDAEYFWLDFFGSNFLHFFISHFPFHFFGLNLEFEPTVRGELFLTVRTGRAYRPVCK